MENRERLYELSTGDTVWRDWKNGIIAIPFSGPRKVVGTSLLNGGYREDLVGVFNHNCGPDDGSDCQLRAATYLEHLRLTAETAGLAPEKATGMGTAADMENVAIVANGYKELTVTAIVTGGVEGNGGRAGDPATYYQPVEKTGVHKPGTINIMLVIDADMPPGTMTRALVTCTEAKTAALQELMAGSLYSTGLATGSGTDQTLIIANPSSPLYFEGAGKHNKVGELIGVTVKQAVTEALQRQTGLSPKKQHSMLRRFQRFGITGESLWQYYHAKESRSMDYSRFAATLDRLDKDSYTVVCASLYVHLLDQLLWGLLTPTEIMTAANELLAALIARHAGSYPPLVQADLEPCLQAWTQAVVICVEADVK
ncbi:MAG TPA: adenosylcobinamide amidohydrolase [Negativicutes bacterium]|nr:adenosylcobinamide amidohydrolase [Negativicutes bacterium]